MYYCEYCGKEIDASATICPHCGMLISSAKKSPLEESKAVQAIKNTVSDAAGKASSILDKAFTEQKENARRQAQEQIRRANAEPKREAPISGPIGTQYMSKTELWSWLKKDAKRQQFYTPSEEKIDQEEYWQHVQDKLSENSVPAELQKRTVKWDRSKVERTICVIQPKTQEVNPLSCLLQFNHVGDFTFVEEKTFITPPDLPPVPQKPVALSPEDAKKGLMCVLGVLLMLLGLLILLASFEAYRPGNMIITSLLLLGAGGALTWYGYLAVQKLREIKRHNDMCARQEAAWNRAWSDWQDSIFLHSFQEDINGHLSRVFDAAFECIKQVNRELFDQKTVSEQEDAVKMNELEELIARRKDDYR